jgi:hypothetical protein
VVDVQFEEQLKREELIQKLSGKCKKEEFDEGTFD